MRFTLIKNLNKDKTMKPILVGLLSFTLLYLLIDIFVKKISFGLTPLTVTQTLFGDEEEYLDPITQSTFLEFIHTEIFFIMMILLTLSAIFIRVSKNYLAVHITMSMALLSLLTLGLSYYISAQFIPIYIGTFFIWHLGAIYMSLFSIWKLNDKSI